MNTIGRYQLVEKLGQGGMGVVYRAFDPLLQRVVAVKLIGAIEPGSDLRERFFREARAAGQLSHKNIITIHDLGEHEGQPFLAMEFLEGQDLQMRMAGQAPLTLARKLELAIEICEGIEYAHDHGVIHRDIKPANIFITAAGTAKILDFGLARLITSELTNSNMMMGTLNYMSPEQVRGERADHRSDIFSTGVVLYELFGGRKAFEGDSFGATLYKILEEIPEPLGNLDDHLPAEIIATVEHALEKPRDTRYQHMDEMVRDLVTFRQQLMLTNSPPLAGSSAGIVRGPSGAPSSPGSQGDQLRAPATPSGPGVSGQTPELAHDAMTIAGVATPTPAATPGWGSASGSAGARGSAPGSGPWETAASSDARSSSGTGQGSQPAPGLEAMSAAGIGPGAAGAPVSGRVPVPGTSVPPDVRSPLRRFLAIGAGVAVLAAALATWAINRESAAPPAQPTVTTSTPPATSTTQQEIATRLEQASRALQAGDQAAAQRHAEAVLAMSPGHVEASRVRDQARQASETADRGIASARDALAAGRFDDATRAAGEVLAVEPTNAEAKRVMDEAGARSRGKGAEEARLRMTAARKAAASAAASKLAAAPYAAALAAERDGLSLYKRGRLPEAMAKFWEATGLFRSAEVAAQTEAAARSARATADQTEPKPPAATTGEGAGAPGTKPVQPTPAAPTPAPQPPSAPAPPPLPPVTSVPGTSGLPLPPAATPGAPAVAPAPPPAVPDSATQLATATSAINELLDRYKRALEGRSVDALKRVWPDITSAQESAIRYEFQNANRIEVEILNPQTTVTGTTATVQFVRRYQLNTVDGQRLRTDTRTTMSLQRRGNGWTIHEIRFEPVR